MFGGRASTSWSAPSIRYRTRRAERKARAKPAATTRADWTGFWSYSGPRAGTGMLQIALQRLDVLLNRGERSVGLVDRPADVGWRRDEADDLGPNAFIDLSDRLRVHGVGHGDLEPGVREADGDCSVGPSDRLREQRDRPIVRGALPEVGQRDPELLRERTGQGDLIERAEFDQQ